MILRKWTWWAHTGGGNTLHDIERVDLVGSREAETPLPSNSPHDIERVDLLGSHGRWKHPCLQTAHMILRGWTWWAHTGGGNAPFTLVSGERTSGQSETRVSVDPDQAHSSDTLHLLGPQHSLNNSNEACIAEPQPPPPHHHRC
jgi:hypothetical protein